MQRHAGWEPGWEDIENAFCTAYGRDAAAFIGIECISDRPSPLKGVGVYRAERGYTHLVTKGLSQIAPNADAFGAARSGLGFELTAKCAARDLAALLPLLRLLERLACYAETRKTFFRPYTAVSLSAKLGVVAPAGCAFAAVALAPDTEIPSVQTPHGCVELMQLVPICAADWARVKRSPRLIRQCVYAMQKEDPGLILPSARIDS